MNRYEKRKLAIEKAIREEIEAYKAIYKRADDEDRDPTDEERLDIESKLKAIETLKHEEEASTRTSRRSTMSTTSAVRSARRSATSTHSHASRSARSRRTGCSTG